MSYIICSDRRTGSTLLCEALRHTNVAGNPAEYFGTFPPTASYRQRYLGIRKDTEFIQKVIEKSTTSNGVFGTKVHLRELPVLLSKIQIEGKTMSASSAVLLSSRFPNLHYIWIRRENEIRQAISLYRAHKTKVWWQFIDDNSLSRSMYQQVEMVQPDGDFNFIEIYNYLSGIKKTTSKWEKFFTENNISPLRLTYEELDADYEKTISRVLHYLELPADTPIPPKQTKRLADARTDEWEKKFLEIYSRHKDILD